ncbi:PSP1 domain-containing protein [Chengkuizengella axinellae]|uniref:Stage 0 sporulation family protein n=1 Tax=Chengkuizengella axinellae TaxID=3064388 RepID=A0ABT9J7J8_9BACL|nr:stage 0 sporulation family protein [Chengkuizengella sp. 2205SS18-9]MDP5276929.1 stage 0 sporulation family protein [Chengkuizengella sp. 2205SS18-9]
MYSVIGVRFKKAGKIYYFDPTNQPVSKDDHVIVETARGIEYGTVVIGEKQVDESDIVLPLKKVIRIAKSADVRVMENNKKDAKEAFYVCLDKISQHQLIMKLIDVEYTFDRNKIIFYFTAEGRVDFRELVKDLASIFKTRIELRQIGVRDEAKMLGGIGPCGRTLCCSTWLGDFEPVSIKMAKDQRLSLNPTKISGLCGRLMCCLKFEHDQYESAKNDLPKVGSFVITSLGEGKVVSINPDKNSVQVKIFDIEKVKELSLEDVVEQE